MKVTLRLVSMALGFGLVSGALTGRAEARDPAECQESWGRAVRSYLTQNRKSGPEDAVFAPACALEGQGKKDEARVEAVIIGARALAKLDLRGCQHFMENYVASSKPKDVCDAATGGDENRLRTVVKESMPARPEGKSTPKKGKK